MIVPVSLHPVRPPRATSMVVIFETRITDRNPTFHRWGPHQFDKVDLGEGEEIRSSTFLTACGLLMDHTRWFERYAAGGLDPVVIDEGGKRWIGMRFDNASAIGTPCGKCWRGQFGSSREHVEAGRCVLCARD